VIGKLCLAMTLLFLCNSCNSPAGALNTVAKDRNKEPSPVVGTVWQWVQTLYSDGKTIVPSEPAHYTLKFQDKGALDVKADCNLKGGRYAIEENRLTLEITHSTMAACQEGSLENLFVRDLTAASSIFVQDGNLYIDLKYDSGTMKFSRQ
jgi:heat shock protein HslJ